MSKSNQSDNNLATLRDHLFDTIARLKDEKNPMDVERALAVADVAKTIIDTAKVEIGYIRATDANVESAFIGSTQNRKAITQSSGATTDHNFECGECGRKFDDQAGLVDHHRTVRQTGRHPRAVAVING